MTFNRRKLLLQIGILAAVAAVSVLLLLSPQKPPLPAVSQELATKDSLNEEVAKAIEMVQNPNLPPMQGILILRQIANEHPNYAEAQFQLGKLSIQSTQYEKAVARFEKVIEIDSERLEALLLLGNAHAALGNKEAAIKAFEEYLKHPETSEDRDQVIRLIEELKNS
ncbi:MAG: tetratricopeptide repeat protein [Salibacteraceae bacterium]